MRFLTAVLVSLLILATVPQPGGGARLDRLFAALQQEEDGEAAGLIELMIWREWSTPPGNHPGIRLLMDAARDHLVAGEPVKAVAAMDAVIRIAPAYAEAWNRRATAYYQAGNYHAAVADIAHTLKLEPRHFGALSGLGRVNLALGRMQPALEAYEAALEINPHLRSARLHAAAIRAAMAESF